MFILSQVLASSTLSGSYRFWTQPTETSSDRMGGGFDELGGIGSRKQDDLEMMLFFSNFQ